MLPVMRYRSTGACGQPIAMPPSESPALKVGKCHRSANRARDWSTRRITPLYGSSRINFLVHFGISGLQSSIRGTLPRAAGRLRKQDEANRRRAALGLCCGRSLALIDDHLLTSTQQHHL